MFHLGGDVNIRSTFTISLFVLAVPILGFSQDAVPAEDIESAVLVDETTLLISDDEGAAPGASGSLNVFGAWDLIRMVLILAAVVGIIYLIYFLLKRSTGPRLQENNVIKVVSSVQLSSGRTLHLVEVGSRLFLIGSAESSVSLVSEIEDKESVDEIRLRVSEGGGESRGSFIETLSGVFSGGAKLPSLGLPAANPLGFMRQQKERLKKM